MWPGLLIGALIFIAFLFIVKKKNPKAQKENSTKSDEYEFGLDQEDAEELKKRKAMIQCDIHDWADKLNGWHKFKIINTKEDYFIAQNIGDEPKKIYYDWVFEWKII